MHKKHCHLWSVWPIYCCFDHKSFSLTEVHEYKSSAGKYRHQSLYFQSRLATSPSHVSHINLLEEARLARQQTVRASTHYAAEHQLPGS